MALLLLGTAVTGLADIEWYSVPTNLYGPITAADGALWFTAKAADGLHDAIGRLDLSGVVTLYPTSRSLYGSHMTKGPDGAVWFTARSSPNCYASDFFGVGRVGKSGVVTEFRVPSLKCDSHITSGPDGALWFVARNGISRITTAGEVTEYPLPPDLDVPTGITTGPDGALWFCSGYTKIGRITTSGVVSEYTTPWGAGYGIAPGPDGALWFTAGEIRRITTAGIVSTFAASAAFITAGPDGALWFSGPSVGRITVSGEVTTYTHGLSTGAIASGPDAALWYTDTTSRRIGRLVPGPADAFPLRSHVDPLAPTSAYPFFDVYWSGTGAGIVAADIYVSDNAGPFQPWITFESSGAAKFFGRYGHTYGFYSIAHGLNGSREDPKTVAEATIRTPPLVGPTSRVSALPPASPAAFTVRWSATNGGGTYGISEYSIYVSDNGAPFVLWSTLPSSYTQANYYGSTGHTYGFYSIARNTIYGVEEEHKTAAEAVTRTPVPPPFVPPGDLNADGAVNCVDIAIVRGAYGKRTGQQGFDIRADVNRDGVVDLRDLGWVSQRLPAGTQCTNCVLTVSCSN